jgi:hypothetical protein
MIKAYIQAFFAFAKSVFSDAGQGSFSRCGSGAIVVCTLSWISYVVFKTKALPDLGGPSMFLVAGVGACYGTNKIPDIMAALKGK